MTRQLLKHAVAVILIVAMPAVMSPVWATGSTASVMGRVLGEDARTPVTGAVVKIQAGEGEVVASQPTTADGSFKIADLEPGAYAVTVETTAGAYKVGDALALEADTTRLVQMSLRKDAAAATAGGGGGAVQGGSGGGGGGSNTAPLIGIAIIIVVGLLASQTDDDGGIPPSGSVSPSVPGN